MNPKLEEIMNILRKTFPAASVVDLEIIEMELNLLYRDGIIEGMELNRKVWDPNYKPSEKNG